MNNGAIVLAALLLVPNYAPPPGALNPNVTQAMIDQTICVRGYAQSIRPSAQYTNELKKKQMQERHLPGSPRDYEEDHFIPLELGGAPYNPQNLWPQPIEQARRKDKLEDSLHGLVCAHKISLREAQQEVADPKRW